LEEIPMSKDAIAGVYTQMLSNDAYRRIVADEPDVLKSWDLTREEKAVLIKEARLKQGKSPIESRPVLAYLRSHKGPMLSPPVASALGVALNLAAGLPVAALNGPGFLSNAACCPWGKPVIGKFRGHVLPALEK
jgi:hypothetical protein